MSELVWDCIGWAIGAALLIWAATVAARLRQRIRFLEKRQERFDGVYPDDLSRRNQPSI